MPNMPTNLANFTRLNNQVLYPDFITHLNYLKCLSHFSNNIILSNSLNISGQMSKTRSTDKKIKLIELTLENIEEEFKKIQQFNDYSQICVSWIPVKSYYLIFNLLLVLASLIEGDENLLNSSHININRKFIEYISRNQLSFSNNEFNQMYCFRQVFLWRIPIGNNIIRNQPNYQLLKKQLIKKLIEYKKEEYKRTRNIKRLTGREKNRFEQSCSTNIFEFFYWYRIKANYRDMEFITSGVTTNDFFDFYSNYYNITKNIFNAFKTQINYFSSIRFNNYLLK